MLACRNLQCAQAVLIQVVGVLALYAESGVAVAVPAAAQIKLVEDSADAVLATEGESESVVFAVRSVRELNLSQDRREESARRAESVYAQRVVRSVLVGPLFVVDKSRRERLELEVAHAVGAHNHRSPLLVKLVDDALQRLRRRVEVVAVELHGEASAACVVYSHVPATADAEVGALGYDMYEALVLGSSLFEDV